MTSISGAFRATYDGLALGAFENGLEEITTPVYEEIRADHYRGTLDAVFQGVDMVVRGVLYGATLPAVRKLIWPWDQLIRQNDENPNDRYPAEGVVGSPGFLLSQIAHPLVLSPCLNTPAHLYGLGWQPGIDGYQEALENTNDPQADPEGPTIRRLATITYGKAVIASDAVSKNFSASQRKIPVTILILPQVVNMSSGDGGEEHGFPVLDDSEIDFMSSTFCSPLRYYEMA